MPRITIYVWDDNLCRNGKSCRDDNFIKDIRGCATPEQTLTTFASVELETGATKVFAWQRASDLACCRTIAG